MTQCVLFVIHQRRFRLLREDLFENREIALEKVHVFARVHDFNTVSHVRRDLYLLGSRRCV